MNTLTVTTTRSAFKLCRYITLDEFRCVCSRADVFRRFRRGRDLKNLRNLKWGIEMRAFEALVAE